MWPVLLRGALIAFRALKWLFTGTRLAGGSMAVAINLAGQLWRHGDEWSRYNWGSLGFDYALGVLGYEYFRLVSMRWPLFIHQTGMPTLLHRHVWTQFGKQQSAFVIFSVVSGIARADNYNTDRRATVDTGFWIGALAAIPKNCRFGWERVPCRIVSAPSIRTPKVCGNAFSVTEL